MGNCTASQRAVESWADDGEWGEEASSSEEGDHHHHHDHDHHHGRRDEHASEVTIRITKRQLHDLMEKRAGGGGHGLQLPVLGSRRSTEQLLADIMNSGEVHHHREEHWHWKPALQSIPEAAVES